MHQGYVNGDWQYKCENCSKGFDSRLVYGLHWVSHKIRNAGSILGSALMIGMNLGDLGDVSRRSDRGE